MKRFVAFIVFALIAFSAFSQQVNSNDLKTFCINFSEAVLSGDVEKCLEFFDPGYLKIQHQDFLNERSEQFLNEFLTLYLAFDYNDDNAKQASFRDIKSMILFEIATDNANNKIVVYFINLKNGSYYYLTAKLKIFDNNKFGFFGAVG